MVTDLRSAVATNDRESHTSTRCQTLVEKEDLLHLMVEDEGNTDLKSKATRQQNDCCRRRQRREGERDKVFVDFADEDHGDDFHGGSVGDSEAIEEVGLDVESTQPLVDLGATAVDEDDADAGAGEEDDCSPREGSPGLGPKYCSLDFTELANQAFSLCCIICF